MKVRNIRACMFTLLFVSFFSSVAFAQASLVTDRASLAGTDYIDWGLLDDGGADGFPADTLISSPISLLTEGLIPTGGSVAVTVSQQYFAELFPNSSLIFQLPYSYFPTDLPDGDYLNWTFTDPGDNRTNVITFSDFGSDICGLGTDIAPEEAGVFHARIEAFYASGSTAFVWPEPEVPPLSHTDLSSVFIGVESDTPMSRVEISMLSTGNGGGHSAASYAISHVDLRVCPDPEPELPPVLSCDGFAAPMNKGPVKAKKNRAFPLKMELFDEFGVLQTDLMIAAPMVTVVPTSSSTVAATDVNNDALGAGHGSDGNQFNFTDDGIWQFNLKSKNYSGSGTYEISVVSGSPSEYVISPSCEASFIIK